MITLSGKTAIVTGAARGIGAACARAFAEHGSSVVLSDVREDEAAATAAAIAEDTGSETSSIRCDVSMEADCDALLAHCIELT